MFRTAIFALRSLRPLSSPYYNATRIICNDFKNFSTNRNISSPTSFYNLNIAKGSLLCNKQILSISDNITKIPVRTVTKFSLKKGKRKTVKAVVKRFFRLHWGAWIRPKVGRQKRLWKKSPPQRRRLKDHVFCNATQTTLLDKMVTKFWKRPKYYVDDPYAPYHTREEFTITRKRPIVRN
ncbi:large ribosomal subunit protein bL35m [Amyelois transitella]|uniref:large ribosomal subunit protein bL35m n=1 Tax=Amyelois transitella TaxID=680683 RepID=UPI00067E4F53|nr:large ribosomal subunit protein bL35m [Amyelois transitella]